MTTETLALAATGYAALHQLPHLTVRIDPDLHDVPAYVDRDTNTIVVQACLPLQKYVLLLREGITTLCLTTVVERDDGGTEWAPETAAVGQTHGPEAVAARPRPTLRLV